MYHYRIYSSSPRRVHVDSRTLKFDKDKNGFSSEEKALKAAELRIVTHNWESLKREIEIYQFK